MKLQDVFDMLGNGEFSQLAIGGQPAGVINEGNAHQVLTHVNLGLTALYRRFALKESQVKLALQSGQTIYQLLGKFAVTSRSSREAVRYLLDSAENPFKDDVLLKISRVLTDKGVEFPLNDANDPLSCTTPSLTTLVVPDQVANPTNCTPDWARTATLDVRYRANHAHITVPLGLFDPSRITLELPYSHLEALCYFVASRVNNPIGMTNEFHAGNNYAAKYEAACLELKNLGLETNVGGHNMKLCRKGFP